MGKMNELSQAIDQLIACGETLIKTGNALKDFYSSPGQVEAPVAKPAPEKKEEPDPVTEIKQYTKEAVRALLAGKANESGGQFKAQVKAIVKKYSNGGSLTDVPADSYPALVKEVGGLTDA